MHGLAASYPSRSIYSIQGMTFFRLHDTEVTEELGLQEETLPEPALMSGYLTENWNVCLLFYQRIKIASDQLSTIFKQRSDGEAKQLVIIPKDESQKHINLFEPKDQIKFALLNIT